MEELPFIFAFTGGILLLLALRSLLTSLLYRRATNSTYLCELNDVLTKDEHRVKGRFE